MNVLSPYISFVGSLWCSKYLWIISLVTFHVVDAKYHALRKCFHQYFFFSSGNSCWRYLLVFPLNLFIISLMLNFGGNSICICTWSVLTTHFNTTISKLCAIWTRRSRHLNLSFHVRTWYLYFVHRTKCTEQFVRVWLHLLYHFMLLISKVKYPQLTKNVYQLKWLY